MWGFRTGISYDDSLDSYAKTWRKNPKNNPLARYLVLQFIVMNHSCSSLFSLSLICIAVMCIHWFRCIAQTLGSNRVDTISWANPCGGDDTFPKIERKAERKKERERARAHSTTLHATTEKTRNINWRVEERNATNINKIENVKPKHRTDENLL